MKKRFFSLLLALCLMVSATPAAFAASDEATAAAERLYSLGLFSGTGKDENGYPLFDLDRAPTRHEAVTMLVNLLGKGEEAKAGTWETPFTDVADWAKPFVGYAYANGLTSGTSPTTFGGNTPITAAQYLTFVLKVLGYSAGADFQWDKAWELSDSLGVTDGRYNADTKTFLRGDAAIVSRAALDAPIKGTDTTLQDRLTDEGVLRAWYEVDEMGRLFLKTNLKSNPRTSYSVLNWRYLKDGNVDYDSQGGGTDTVIYSCGAGFFYGEVTTRTGFYVFDDTNTWQEFWDYWNHNWKENSKDNGLSDALASVSDHIVADFVLDTTVTTQKNEGQFDITDFSITYDPDKGEETYTATLSVPVEEKGEYGLLFVSEGGRKTSHIGRANDHLEYTREIGHFVQAGLGGKFYITHCVYSQLENGDILCEVTISNPFPYKF